jgi:tetratricopeptide (TPR) repeat protein
MRLNNFLFFSFFLISSCSQTSMPEAGSTEKSDSQTKEVASEPETKESTKNTVLKTSSEESEKAPEVPAGIKRETLEGRWILSMYQRLISLPVALIEIKKADGSDEYKVTTLEIHSSFPPSKPDASWAKKDEVQITFDAGDGKFIFSGKHIGGLVKGTGTFIVQNGSCLPAELVPTEVETLEGIKPVPAEYRELYVSAVSSDSPFKSLQEFINNHSESAIAFHANLKLIEISKKNNLNDGDVEKLIRSYVTKADKWGKSLGIMARINSVFALLNSDNSPKLALKISNEAKSLFDEQSNFLWEELLNRASKQATHSIVLDDALNGKGDVREKAILQLKDLQKDDPFNPLILLTLASHDQKNGNIDQAMETYAKIVSFPSLERMLQQMQGDTSTDTPSPMESLTRLWKEKNNGSTDELEEYINKVYKDKITDFVKEDFPPRKPEEGNRRVLMEFFTGGMCPPCVGADIALSGLTKKYAETELIQLTYHQHIPGPDSLASTDTEARFSQYGLRGTPTVTLNGKQIKGVASGLPQAVEIYESMQNLIDPVLEEKTDIKIELKATANDGNLDISVEVKGIKEIPETYRLRMALAESEIDLTVRTGIRVHHMTVREMPGGIEGISPTDGKLKYSDTISLGHLKKRLENYLSNYAEGLGISFGEVPLEFNNMKFVAFVQDEKTGEVLQVHSIPVEGKLIFNPVPAEEKSDSPELEPEDK